METTLDSKLSTISTELKTFLESQEKKDEQLQELKARMMSVEQKFASRDHLGSMGGSDGTDLGWTVAQSDGFKALQSGAKSSGEIRIGRFHKTNIINATALNQPLVQDFRTPIVAPAQQKLTIRDLMPSFPTTSNMIQFPRESSFTNSAAPQTSEGAVKGESAMTFELLNSPVQTLAHFIPASKQILDDAPSLQAYINGRMLYMLKLKEENQLLNGTGSGNNILGLIAQSTPFDTTFSTPSTDTYIDVIAKGIEQVQLSNFDPDGIILNPKDFWRIALSKTSGGGADGRYLYTDPAQALNPRMWGLPIVVTASMTEGQFMVGAFRLASAIWDREDATIEISREHSDFFTRNLVAILAEERLALTVFQPTSIIFGGFPYGS